MAPMSRGLSVGQLQLLARALAEGWSATPACMHGSTIWDSASRGPGSVSTSWLPAQGMAAGTAHQQRRSFAKVAAGGGGKAPVVAAPPPKAPAAPLDPKLASPLALLKHRFRRGVNPIALLSDEQKQAAQALLPVQEAVPGEGEQSTVPEATSFKQVGVPLSGSDTLRLMHQSMSRAAGEDVQLRPFVFSNVFQSAPAVAQYVANALEAGTNWQRVERFFLSSVEEDRNIAAIKVQVKGRIGRKASMAGKKVWEQGSLKLGELSHPIDFGTAQAMTRMGLLGVKVWIRFKPMASAPALMPRHAPVPAMSMIDILTAARTPLPTCPSAWWSTPGPAQPMAHRTWRALVPDFSPTSSSVNDYLATAQPVRFKSDKERQAYLRSEGARSSASSSGDNDKNADSGPAAKHVRGKARHRPASA